MIKDCAVAFERVSHRYGNTPALAGITYQVPRGAIFGLIGPNGSGKSTTLNIITGRLAHSEGMVQVCGKNVREHSEDIKRLIGYAPEEVKLYEGLTAQEFVELSGTLHHMSPEAATAAAHTLLLRFGLDKRRNEQLGSFSKGMRRKALLAAAMVHEPEILILDEPLEGLDVIAQKILKDIVREIANSGRTVIYSTHILEVLTGFCSHVVLLDRGELLACGPLDEVKNQLGVADLADVFLQRANQ